ncbi:MAG: PaaI family thioesterase [Thermoplasmatota archaeon]
MHASPYDAQLDFRTLRRTPEGSTIEATVGPSHHNPTGILHGGMIAGLADSAMGETFLAGLPEGARGCGIDLHLEFVGAVTEGTLTAEARVVKRGRTLTRIACQITDADGRLVATARSSFLVLAAAPS